MKYDISNSDFIDYALSQWQHPDADTKITPILNTSGLLLGYLSSMNDASNFYCLWFNDELIGALRYETDTITDKQIIVSITHIAINENAYFKGCGKVLTDAAMLDFQRRQHDASRKVLIIKTTVPADNDNANALAKRFLIFDGAVRAEHNTLLNHYTAVLM